MTATVRTPIEQWTQKQALILSAICLTAGIAGGWSIRAWRSSAVNEPAQVATAPIGKLKSDSSNPELLTSIGNVYYDAQQYATAVDYYGRALKSRPDTVPVRTDMATAYWYMGDADRAIAEYNKALTYAPNNPNTLFNRGLVKWRGKKDAAGALADFKKLLAIDPKYAGKAEVDKMTAEANSQSAAKPAAN